MDALAGDRVRREAAVRDREVVLRTRLRHVVRNEILRECPRTVPRGELRHEEALNTEERHSAELDLRYLDDPELDPALLQGLSLPRPREPDRRLLLEERVLGLAVVDLRVDQALCVPLVDQRRVLEEGLVRNAQLLRVERTVLRSAEDESA